MNSATVPGSDRERGHCSALGQEPFLWQGEKEGVDQGVHSPIPEAGCCLCSWVSVSVQRS